MNQKMTYSERILKGGRFVSWQRFARFRAASDAISRHAAEGMRRDLLDIGAADGIGLPFWKPLVERVVSINYYENHTLEFQAAHPGEEVITADARDLGLPDASFDVVVSFETLHLIPERRLDAIAEIHRVLRPGGVLVCSVPIEIGYPALMKFVARGVTGFGLDGMNFGMALRHAFSGWTDVSQYDQGRQVGFDAYHFLKDATRWFEIIETKSIPLAVLMPFNLLFVARRKDTLER
ncbi:MULTISPECIES: class I SAM-dependent methyltransferase [Ectothiorhodospira]|uniref:class I SAM-dependent methyltransferase n=1 Tax=Ectothiorhodospira TaxID=1051 RepID=UPI001903631C|nr:MULTISPECIES: class I SAM-dependent methyltransferase [Ectothiorhodospira]MCG5501302.1 class I SAM-dependent methyltransferase [Ectothiorhodospira lacustris]